jgi:hypothetical protein
VQCCRSVGDVGSIVSNVVGALVMLAVVGNVVGALVMLAALSVASLLHQQCLES